MTICHTQVPQHAPRGQGELARVRPAGEVPGTGRQLGRAHLVAVPLRHVRAATERTRVRIASHATRPSRGRCRRFKYEIFTPGGRWMHNAGYQLMACGADKVSCKKQKIRCLNTCGGSDGAEYKHDFATIVSSTELSQFVLGDGFDTQAAADCTVRSYTFKVPPFRGGDSFATFASRMRVRSEQRHPRTSTRARAPRHARTHARAHVRRRHDGHRQGVLQRQRAQLRRHPERAREGARARLRQRRLPAQVLARAALAAALALAAAPALRVRAAPAHAAAAARHAAAVLRGEKRMQFEPTHAEHPTHRTPQPPPRTPSRACRCRASPTTAWTSRPTRSTAPRPRSARAASSRAACSVRSTPQTRAVPPPLADAAERLADRRR